MAVKRKTKKGISLLVFAVLALFLGIGLMSKGCLRADSVGPPDDPPWEPKNRRNEFPDGP